MRHFIYSFNQVYDAFRYYLARNSPSESVAVIRGTRCDLQKMQQISKELPGSQALLKAFCSKKHKGKGEVDFLVPVAVSFVPIKTSMEQFLR